MKFLISILAIFAVTIQPEYVIAECKVTENDNGIEVICIGDDVSSNTKSKVKEQVNNEQNKTDVKQNSYNLNQYKIDSQRCELESSICGNGCPNPNRLGDTAPGDCRRRCSSSESYCKLNALYQLPETKDTCNKRCNLESSICGNGCPNPNRLGDTAPGDCRKRCSSSESQCKMQCL